jgi:uncharacterized protein YuzE
MREIQHSTGFGLTVNAREDGTLEAAYVQLSDAKVVRTDEVIKSVLLVDFDANDAVVGIEILAPVKISTVLEVANRMGEAHRKSFDDFVRRYAPPAIIAPESSGLSPVNS